MKLFYSSASPFVRKVLATAIAAGVGDQIERVTTNPWESPAELLAQNPLAKVPCLITAEGLTLFDSPVICDYLDSLGEAGLFPARGPARWRALKQQAIADGIMDAAIIRRMEGTRPGDEARDQVMERQRQIVQGGLNSLETDPPEDGLDIGTITIACCLGWLDFRFAHEPWRDKRPTLAAWFEAFSEQPCLMETVPA